MYEGATSGQSGPGDDLLTVGSGDTGSHLTYHGAVRSRLDRVASTPASANREEVTMRKVVLILTLVIAMTATPTRYEPLAPPTAQAATLTPGAGLSAGTSVMNS